ncbi:MAG: uncharacterized protein KVP18_005243, partial [Porospora cf. gigantea A]|uniref:uncharacterized protein n=1 Tax=Porospora cf. gigantea A TaxID=2853593 RepID=UPI00355AC3B4
MHEEYLEHAPHEGTLRSPAGLIRLTLAPSRGSAPAGPIEDARASVPEVRQIPPFPGSHQSLQSELSRGLLVASSFPPRDGDDTSGRPGPSRDPAPRLGSGTGREDERTRESVRPATDARIGRKRLLRHDGEAPRYPASLVGWDDLELSIPKHGLEGQARPPPTAGTQTRPTTQEALAARGPHGPEIRKPQAKSESRKRNRPGPKSEAKGNPHAKFFAPSWEYGPRTDYTGCGFALPLSGFLEEGPVPAKTDPFSPLNSPHSESKQADSGPVQAPYPLGEDLHVPPPEAPSEGQQEAPGAKLGRAPSSGDAQEKVVKLLETNASEEGQAALQQLLQRYDGLWRGERRGCAQAMSHRISVTSDRPIVTRPRSFTPAQQRVLQEELRSMLDAGVIEPSNSPHASEVVLVRKKDGGWRVCIDFRQVNDVTVPDQYPLPRIADLIREVRQSRYFVALDLQAGYWQVKMEPDSVPYTAFRCTGGLYQFTVMP